MVRVQELTNLDSESIFVSAQRSIPEEFSKPGEALAPLFHEKRQSNTALAPLDSASLIQSGWPWRGEINFVNVSMRYSPDSPLVLKGINIYIPAGSTLGVVGRTGSGKRSVLIRAWLVDFTEAYIFLLYSPPDLKLACNVAVSTG